FLEVRDGSGLVQAVVKRGTVADAAFEAADRVPLESSVAVTGEVRADPRSAGGVELSVKELEIVGACAAEFPIGKKEHGIGFLMEQRHLYLRSRKPTAVLRIRAEKSKTRRHLTEFWMLEPEAAFADLEEVMGLMESLVSHAVARVLERRRADLETLERDVTKLEAVTAPFPRVSYDEALKALE